MPSTPTTFSTQTATDSGGRADFAERKEKVLARIMQGTNASLFRPSVSGNAPRSMKTSDLPVYVGDDFRTFFVKPRKAD